MAKKKKVIKAEDKKVAKKQKAVEAVTEDKPQKVEDSPFDVIEKRFEELEKTVADLTKTGDMQTDAIKHLHHVIDAVAKTKEAEPRPVGKTKKEVTPVDERIKTLRSQIQYAHCDSHDALLTIANILSK